MLKIKLFVIIALFISVSSAYSISDMEQLRQKAKSETFYNSIAFGISGKKGNSDKSSQNGSVFSSYNKSRWLMFITGSYEYEKASGVKSVDESFIHARVNYSVIENHNVELFSQYGRNPFKSLVHRELYGAGYRYEFMDSNALGIGLFYEEEKYRTREDQQVRANIYATGKMKLSKSSDVAGTLYYQPQVDKVSDYRILAKVFLNMFVTKNITGKIGAVWSYNSEPEQGIKNSDLTYVSGLSLSF